MPRISATLTRADHLGTWCVRCGFKRMSYLVEPGLYGVGNPTAQSMVLVTANYKLSFDHLRKELAGQNIWVLVLEAFGINVWCAAGKGTFGTDELCERIRKTGLKKIVSHRLVILPQLAAPGVAAHKVKAGSGFSVQYGPILAGDIPRYLSGNREATPEMRRRRFPLSERAVLLPVELMLALRWLLPIMLGLFLLFGLPSLIFLLTGLVSGAVVTPLCLPWIPGRAFSLKGGFVGVIFAGISGLVVCGQEAALGLAGFDIGVLSILAITLSSFLAMNFTGATPFTSLSGVKREMHYAVPLQVTMLLGACILWGVGRFI